MDSSAERIIEQESGGPKDHDPFAQLDERLDNPPKLWAPRGVPDGVKTDDCIVEESVRGIVEETDTRTGDYGPYPVVTLVRRDKSRVNVFGLGTVLKGRLAKVRVGDAVGIAYLGTRPASTPGMKDYDNYDVVVLRDGKPVGQSISATNEPAEDYVAADLPLPDDDA